MAGENQNPGGTGQNPGGEPKPGAGAPATPKWREALAPELKGAKTLDKFRGETWEEVGPQVLSSYVNLEKLHGGSVRIPGENATPEEWAEFHRKIGVPDAPDKYGVEAAVPEGMPWDKEGEKAFLALAHQQGLTKKQAKGLLDWYVGVAQKGIDGARATDAEAVRKGTEALTKKWGANRDRNVALVQRAAQEYGGVEFTALLDTELPGLGKLGNHPVMNEFLHRLGEMSLEHGFISGDGGLLGPSDAKAEIQKVKDNKDHPYWKKDDPGHAAAVKKMAEWHEIVFPNR